MWHESDSPRSVWQLRCKLEQCRREAGVSARWYTTAWRLATVECCISRLVIRRNTEKHTHTHTHLSKCSRHWQDYAVSLYGYMFAFSLLKDWPASWHSGYFMDLFMACAVVPFGLFIRPIWSPELWSDSSKKSSGWRLEIQGRPWCFFSFQIKIGGSEKR